MEITPGERAARSATDPQRIHLDIGDRLHRHYDSMSTRHQRVTRIVTLQQQQQQPSSGR